MISAKVIKCTVEIFLVFILFFVLCGETMAEKLVLRFGDEASPGFANYKAHAKFAELVKERTNGRIIIEHYGSGALGAGKALIEACLVGGVEIATSSVANMTHFTKGLEFLSLPYLFGNLDDLDKFRQSDLFKGVLENIKENMKVKVLLTILSGGGSRHLFHTAKKDIRLPQDLKGMKIRTTGAPTEVALLQAWGARPTPVDWGEVYTSLQQGVVDGTHNPYLWLYMSKFQEICKGVTEVNAEFGFVMTFINLKSWNKLSKEDQEILLAAGKEAGEYADKLNIESDQWAKEQFLKAGVRIYVPTPEEELIWKSKAMESWDQFVGPTQIIKASFIGKVMHVLLENRSRSR